ncbi:hypothetical protein T10_8789 [Trichinella papuae]|uniref:Uncharacterized protein n=1 Tax=Trichinella papuae TaxID=268474 RepID=A0A0V1MS66_9BILA|nr:hypothetical protein T10_8789 [Trichinella papuae]
MKNLIIVLKRLIWCTGAKLKSDVAKFHFGRQLTVKMDGAKVYYNCETESIFTVIDSLDYALIFLKSLSMLKIAAFCRISQSSWHNAFLYTVCTPINSL